jgi:hypothetical protein
MVGSSIRIYELTPLPITILFSSYPPLYEITYTFYVLLDLFLSGKLYKTM